MRMGAAGAEGGGWDLAMRWLAIGLLAAGLVACKTPSQRKELPEGAAGPGRIAALRGPGPPTRIIMITVAGLAASDYLNAYGYVATAADDVRMPNVARLAREGALGERALPPSPGSSYASHATLVTGKLPSRHGVVADTKVDVQETTVTPFWENDELVGTALWDAAIGRGVMALGWPTTVGARIELILPEARPSEDGQPWLNFMRQISSPYLINQLQVIADEALSTGTKGLTGKRSPESWPTPLEKDAAIAEIACYVALSDRDPGLWLIRLDQTENALRVAGAGSAEVAAALRNIDDEIGSLIGCLEETGQLANSAIFIVGDVAYAPVHTRVDPNVALVARGLIGRDPRSAIGVRSWLAVARSQGRSAYVYAKDAGNAVIARKVLELEAERTGAFRVVPAGELAETDVDPQAWFGLAALPGYEIGDGLAKPILKPAETRASPGALRAEGDLTNAVGFVAWGRGIRGQVRLSQVDLVDIAPTIAVLFGLRLDEKIDGKPISGILRAATPPPPPGPKRLGVGADGDVDRSLRDMGGGRR